MSNIDSKISQIKTGAIQKLIEQHLVQYEKYKDNESRNAIIDLLKICELIHQGRTFLRFSQNDLPSDSFYEYACQIVNYKPIEDFSNLIFPMGSVNKNDQIDMSGNIIITPKFDGVSIGMILRKNENTFKENEFIVEFATTRQSKICTLEIKELLHSVNISKMIPSDIFKECHLSEIKSIKVRGELVLRTKSENVVSAATASGWLKRGIDGIKEHYSELRIIAYEIAEIETDSKKIQLNQRQSLRFLNQMFANYKDCSLNFGSPWSIVEGNLLKEDPYKYYEIFSTNGVPLDGIVYCKPDWVYPLEESKFNKVAYGKIAWKPSPMFESFVSGLQITISGNGKYSFCLEFLPLQIEGKIYSKSKIQYYEILDKKFKIGDRIRIELSNGITAVIHSKIENGIPLIQELMNAGLIDENYQFESNHPNGFEILTSTNCLNENLKSDGIIEFTRTQIDKIGQLIDCPKKCIECQEPLEYGDKEIFCRNEDCSCQVVKKYSTLLSRIKKENPPTPMNIYDTAHKKFIKSNLTSTRLEDLYDSETGLNLNSLIGEIPNFIQSFESMTLVQRAYCLQIGGMKTLEKMSEKELWEKIRDSFLFK